MRRLLLSLAMAAAGAAGADGIAVNQLGYPPGAAKVAGVVGGEAGSFRVVDAGTGRVVLRGRLGASAVWEPAGGAVRLADFSALRRPGRYRLHVDGLPDSPAFDIAADVYAAVNVAAIKAYYFNRASTALPGVYAGRWARPAGHPDDHVLVHASAVGPGRPEGTVIAAPKGWYDAGDYNKYIVNSGITVYTLLAAWEHFPEVFRQQNLHIPESGNGLPDLLNEALWNLDWMLAMQDPADGGVYAKLTNKGFDGVVMPADATGERYVVGKSTAAALDFAAVMAQASRVFAAFDAQRPGLSARMLAAARCAWDWAQAHPAEVYRQPPDIRTGDYGDVELSDEFAWAGTELWIATGEAGYRPDLDKLAISLPSWGDVKGLAWLTLAQQRHKLEHNDSVVVESRVVVFANELLSSWRASAWRVGLRAQDFDWGSNSGALNRALMLIQAYRLQPRPELLAAAQALFDHVLGRNPLGRSFVTGFGAQPPVHPHHRPSEADGVDEPVPGFLVGGPNPGQQDQAGCPVRYASKRAALSYLDHFCSYASNEVAINWNAPLVYVSAALQALTPRPH
ncbi:glycoside hydrolase family 9 protein [Roseateles saccharophilus]|uniref:Endoglucanase n=1 Tax=Roseateles saccharophilus TaxID=304 RepID=A0A4R3UVQ0_ROSSA|nr:glycoside hydrolase family 9 protein [Roseateles saccharophilus]MDG0833038.1 cellulase [Roseateles saccharophilus]TCU96236.1 non-processive endocellulase [Roseateles saccharophilus]